MKNPFKELPLSLEELVQWKNNHLINPRTKKPIKEEGNIYKIIKKSYNSNKSQVDKIITKTELKQQITENQILESIHEPKKIKLEVMPINDTINNKPSDKTMILKCNEDRDLISMNLFWVEENGTRKIIYPEEQFDQLVFYTDSKNIVRGFEKETIRYMKTYNLTNHPVSTEPIPEHILAQVELVDITQIKNAKTLENLALDVFQYFSKISIFINHEEFLSLSKKHLIKFNYELKDFWLQNFGPEQRINIHQSEVFEKTEEDLTNDSLENIQKYLLSQMEILLKCDVEEYKYMINYIILGALGIVIPQIKEMYPDFSFSFC
jgi:hypothetical protein